jgi:integration host factor subunit alpha
MTKVDIIDTIREKVGFTKADTAKIVDSVFEIIKETLQREDKVKISGFGSFVARKKATRRGRNPQTGSDMEISPRRVLAFKPSAILRASSNRPEKSESDIDETPKEVE